MSVSGTGSGAPDGTAFRGSIARTPLPQILRRIFVEQLRGTDTRLFLVGDEFQSIYGFRHADVDVFRALRAQLALQPGHRGAAGA